MARTTHVKKAQQRYARIPVIDPATGVQKVVAVTRKDGSPKTTKSGREVITRQTMDDKSQPLPPHKCESCGEDIAIGTPYKWVKPKSGPYGGRTRYRHEACPGWMPWDLSDSLGANIQRVQHEFFKSVGTPESPDDVTEALSSAAEGIRELAEQKRESAENMESGFGHATYQSDELNEQADALESWADEVEQADVPELPEPEETVCEQCDGSGEVEDHDADVPSFDHGNEVDQPMKSCDECDGSGQVTPDDPTDEQMENWYSEVEAAIDIVNESPV